MLLRRVTKHVKDQNWFAVGVDFVIVVIGVFIGIQVANWNTARIDRAEESAFLKTLQQDVLELERISNRLMDFRTAQLVLIVFWTKGQIRYLLRLGMERILTIRAEDCRQGSTYLLRSPW